MRRAGIAWHRGQQTAPALCPIALQKQLYRTGRRECGPLRQKREVLFLVYHITLELHRFRAYSHLKYGNHSDDFICDCICGHIGRVLTDTPCPLQLPASAHETAFVLGGTPSPQSLSSLSPVTGWSVLASPLLLPLGAPTASPLEQSF